MVAIRIEDLDRSLAYPDESHVEGAAPQIVHEDHTIALLVHAIRDRCRGRLVQNVSDVQAGDASSVLGGFAFIDPEVGRACDDHVCYRLPDFVAGIVYDFAQDASRDFLRLPGATINHLLPSGVTHESLDDRNRS